MGYLSDHFKRTQAAQQAATSVDPTALEVEREGRTQYEQMLLLLDTHQQQLRNMQSIEARAAHKATLLAEYEPYLQGLEQAGASQQDDVLVTLMLWNFDCGNLTRALDLATLALANKMAMPEQHRRTLPTVVVEETADLLLAGKGVETAEQAIAMAIRADSITEGMDMPDQVRAKLYKANGRALNETTPPETAAALAMLHRALELDRNVGVKKDIEQLERKLKNAAKAEPIDEAVKAGVGSGA